MAADGSRYVQTDASCDAVMRAALSFVYRGAFDETAASVALMRRAAGRRLGRGSRGPSARVEPRPTTRWARRFGSIWAFSQKNAEMTRAPSLRLRVQSCCAQPGSRRRNSHRGPCMVRFSCETSRAKTIGALFAPRTGSTLTRNSMAMVVTRRRRNHRRPTRKREPRFVFAGGKSAAKVKALGCLVGTSILRLGSLKITCSSSLISRCYSSFSGSPLD